MGIFVFSWIFQVRKQKKQKKRKERNLRTQDVTWIVGDGIYVVIIEVQNVVGFILIGGL